MSLRHCVVIGGAGAVGSLFADLLQTSGRQVSVIDHIKPTGNFPFEICDAANLTIDAREMVRTADMVLLALPERVAIEMVPSLCTQMRANALLAHTLSVQSRMSNAIETLQPAVEVVGLNPMFAPSLGVLGRSVAAIVQRGGPNSDELLDLLSSWGGKVIRVTAEEHDRLVAAMQVLTHTTVLAFGAALRELGVDLALVSTLAPPPHATLLAILARISSGTAEVYWDIQSANPYAPAARSALFNAVNQVVSATSSETEFVALLDTNRQLLGAELEVYQSICAKVFDQCRQTSADTSIPHTPSPL
ncbi:prephenate dehydrogenase/arogenate dehydrogenase family protein [Alicyclobacillus sp. ALC3]|uniref:prephenate dehydrogenase/arogenate dehydrogenase family protein n=1 Tax=Alicyclobacillus sp. ALC3 TaxID=2796143 RepID=UPI0023792925|nr:prephenate dehydrogenase/arogenate dehydrogenase family protein [Alicyclobacillus sp. ALC3]WDL95266.1 prephenate dehydrogenase/arogenate dehydrogenase family protein [Alicyclobacillus sp. ALC3]